jgi:hypothetical protein
MTYIYESPDKGKTVYRRKFMDYENREKIIGPSPKCEFCNKPLSDHRPLAISKFATTCSTVYK